MRTFLVIGLGLGTVSHAGKCPRLGAEVIAGSPSGLSLYGQYWIVLGAILNSLA